MMFFKTFSLAIRSILTKKMRSFLTMLGIIIGVMSVVMLVSIGQSTTSRVTNSISSLGTELLTVNITDSDLAITYDEAMALENYSAIESIAPVISMSKTVRYGSEYSSVTVLGITDSYLDVQSRDIQAGRRIVQSDLDWRTNVAIIGTEVAEDLFDSYDVIGKTVTIGDRTFTIVGLMESSGSNTSGSLDNSVYIPFTTAQRISGTPDVSQFYAQADSNSDVGTAETILNYNMLLLTRDEESYSVYNQSDALDTLDDVVNTLSLMLGGISAISLLVGGIGIMNIMLVSVAERTGEIGIRKAIGAKRSNILGQFLIEACVLSMIGGLIGVLLSAAGLWLFSALTSYTVAMEWRAVIAALVFCMFIGVLFGGYPAAKASRMTPIEALQRR
jgi:putative ABC transport system permease protein